MSSLSPATSSGDHTRQATARVEFGPPPGLRDVTASPLLLRRGQLEVSNGADPEQAPEQRCVRGGGPCRIVVATSFPAFAEGLASWLEDEARQWRVTATCVSGPALLAAVAVALQEVVVATDEIGPPELFSQLRASSPTSRMLVLTSVDAPERDAALLRCGVLAVIPATSSQRETAGAVEALLQGRTVVSAEALGLVVAPPRPSGPGLTARQREVLELVAMGQTTMQIAEHLVVTPSTVKTHFRQISERLGVPGGQRALTANAQCLLEQQEAVTQTGFPQAAIVSQTI